MTNFKNLQHSFITSFKNDGFALAQALPLAESEGGLCFCDAISSLPSLNFIYDNHLHYRAPRAVLSQTVVREPDFLSIDSNLENLPPPERTRLGYCSGIFEMLAVWDASSYPVPHDMPGDNWIYNSEKPRFYSLMLRVINFLEEHIGLQKERMFFTIFEDQASNHTRPFLPGDSESREFLIRVLGLDPEQIAADPDNLWQSHTSPSSSNRNFAHHTQLIGTKCRLYYLVDPDLNPGDAKVYYPQSASECAATGFMDLLSALAITHSTSADALDSSDSGAMPDSLDEYTQLPTEKFVTLITFGLERALLCMEGKSRLHDISFYSKLRSELSYFLTDRLESDLILRSPHAHSLFVKILDRLRLLVIASCEGVEFDTVGKGALLKTATAEAYEALRELGLSNRDILKTTERLHRYLTPYYPGLDLHTRELKDFVLQQYYPGLALEKQYCSVGSSLGICITERDITLKPNLCAVRPKKLVPEIDNLSSHTLRKAGGY